MYQQILSAEIILLRLQSDINCMLNPESAEIFLYKPWRPEVIFQFQIIRNVLGLSASFEYLYVMGLRPLYIFDSLKVSRALKGLSSSCTKDILANNCYLGIYMVNFTKFHIDHIKDIVKKCFSHAYFLLSDGPRFIGLSSPS